MPSMKALVARWFEDDTIALNVPTFTCSRPDNFTVRRSRNLRYGL